MKTAEEWNYEHTRICMNDPAVHGQLLPAPQMMKFIRRVQIDALRHAAQNVHDMSRGTKSTVRSNAIDEARDLVLDIASNILAPPKEPEPISQSPHDFVKNGSDPDCQLCGKGRLNSIHCHIKSHEQPTEPQDDPEGSELGPP